MRKILYAIAAVALTVFAASCAREVADVQQNGDLVEVSFNVAMPNTVATKAISDGETAKKLEFRVYDAAGKHLTNLDQTVDVNGKQATVNVKLVGGLEYKFVFWAQKAGQYTIAEDGTITLNPAGMMNSDDWDAFYAKKTMEVTAAFNESITLTRPFAQINVGAVDGDLQVASDCGIDLTTLTSKYIVSKVNTKLNLLDGTVSTPVENVEITAVKYPAAKIKVDETNYDHVAMLYVLAGDKENVNVTLDLAFEQNNVERTITRTVPNVPIQRNYRTNILGNIFTIGGVFTITVDSDFKTPDQNELLQTNLAKVNELYAAGKVYAAADISPEDAGDGVKTVTLPSTTEDVVLRMNFTTAETITVQYADGDKPAKVEIYVTHAAKVVANLTSSTVTIASGSYIAEGDFATAPTTLIIEEGAVVGNLTVRAGTVKVYGSITGKFNATGDAAGTVVECPLPAGETTIPTSTNTPMNIVGEQDAEGNNLTTVKVSSATSIQSNDVTMKNIDIVGSANISVSTSSATFENVNIDTGYRNGGLTLYGTAKDEDDIMLFKNVSIIKSYKALHIMHTGTVQIEDCYLDAVYPFNCNGSTGNMIVKNTTLKGWTSYNNGSVDTYTTTFDDCVFGASEYYGYAFTRPYNSTVYTNCEFEEGFEIGGSSTNCKDGDILTLEFKNCTYKGQPLTVNNNCIIIDDMAVGKHQIIIDGVKYHFAAEGLLVDENGAANMSVASSADLEAAINEIASNSDIDKVNIALAEETYTISDALPSNKVVSFEGNGENTVLSMINTVNTAKGSDLSFKNLTIKSGNDNYKGFQHAASAVYENVTFYGRRTLYELQATFNNCTFIQETYDYNFWTYGCKDLTFNNCIFDTARKALKVYKEADSETKVININNCTFKSDRTRAGKTSVKAAIEIDSSLCPFEVNITNCTAEGFDEGENSGLTLYNFDLVNSAKPTNLIVRVNGVVQTL